MGHVSCSVRICSPFSERDVVARDQPFVPVLLFLIWGYGTVTADNDRAVEQPAKPALASQKDTIVFNSAAPPESVNLFGAETSISSARPNQSSGGLYEGYFDDPFGKCFCPLLIDRIAFGSSHSGSYQSGVG